MGKALQGILHLSPDIVVIWDHLPQVVLENKQATCILYEEDASDPQTQEMLARDYAGLASLAMVLFGEVVSRAMKSGRVPGMQHSCSTWMVRMWRIAFFSAENMLNYPPLF